MNRTQLVTYINTLLNCSTFKDYAPNGLQVEGQSDIQHIVTGVTASKALLEAALDLHADTILVHHGYFWRGEPAEIVGQKRQRLEILLKNNINLLAYHLPLDAHPEFGNNAQLAKRWGLTIDGYFGDQQLGCLSHNTPQPLENLLNTIEQTLQRKALLIGDRNKIINTIAWCSGGAQSYLHAAQHSGADVFITGEISEHCVHFCREMDIAYIAAGHHATEKYGVENLGKHLADKYGLKHHFIDIENPV
jgi:dinuclear metal center YbgI/SA1388 family protein